MFIRGQLAGLFGVPHWASVSFATLTIRKLGKMKRSENPVIDSVYTISSFTPHDKATK